MVDDSAVRPAYYLGVDVGTGSARAGVFDGEGTMVATASRALQLWKPEADYVEQSTEDIWRACSQAVRTAVSEAGVPTGSIRGIGFDATCSLAVIDAEGKPVSISSAGEDEHNVIVWMDHRATEEARFINDTGHDVLRYVGGQVSPEMQTPKLRWLKMHLPETWRRAAHFFDLPDYLTYRATGSTARSLCTTVCKWTYLGHEANRNGKASRDDTAGWADDFWRAIDLGDLVAEGYERIGRQVRPMGEAVGSGLTKAAAEDFGLLPGTPVSVSIIDAHAGGLGVLGTLREGHGEALHMAAMNRRVALIGGTSSCHMVVSQEPRFIGGVWGPYFSAMVPGWWLNEGGQSATGALIDHVIFSHARADEVREKAAASGQTVYAFLNARLEALAKNLEFPARLTRDLHILPYFHGNRSPRADASLRGAIVGCSLDEGIDDLALRYLATVQAVAHGTRHIIEEMNEAGYGIDTILATGGGTKNPIFLRAHADITGCQIVLPREREAVLLGVAMLGAVAAGAYDSVLEAMAAMSGSGSAIEPAGGRVAAYHEAKHAVFHRLYDDFMAYRAIMQGEEGY